MAVNYQRSTNEDLKNYINRTGISDRGRRSDLYDFVQHLVDLDVYDDIVEMYILPSDLNDQSQNKVMAFKDPAKDGVINGTPLNWNLSGFETDINCGFEVSNDYNTDMGILSLFNMSMDAFTTSGDNPITIWNNINSGFRNDTFFIRWGSSGTGGTNLIYQNLYDMQNFTGGITRRGIDSLNYEIFVKKQFLFIGYSLPPPDDGAGNSTYIPVGQILRSEGRSYNNEDSPRFASGGGGVVDYSYLYFTSQSFTGYAKGYHTIHILWKQNTRNLSFDGTYDSIMDKIKTTIGKNLQIP